MTGSHFGRWLVRNLAARRLNRIHAAGRLNVSERTLGYWISGQRQPTAAHLVALRTALDCTGDELLNVLAMDLKDTRANASTPGSG